MGGMRVAVGELLMDETPRGHHQSKADAGYKHDR